MTGTGVEVGTGAVGVEPGCVGAIVADGVEFAGTCVRVVVWVADGPETTVPLTVGLADSDPVIVAVTLITAVSLAVGVAVGAVAVAAHPLASESAFRLAPAWW